MIAFQGLVLCRSPQPGHVQPVTSICPGRTQAPQRLADSRDPASALAAAAPCWWGSHYGPPCWQGDWLSAQHGRAVSDWNLCPGPGSRREETAQEETVTAWRLRPPSSGPGGLWATLTSLPSVLPFQVLITSSRRSTSKTQT